MKKPVEPIPNKDFGTMTVSRGKVYIPAKDTIKGDEKEKRISLYSWDVIQDCQKYLCPAADHCTYKQSGKCSVMVQYLKSTSAMFFDNFGGKVNETDFYRIGMHLMPLYANLCRFKIEEMGVKRVILTGAGERKYPHPVFKEIRSIIKLIEFVWRNLGLSLIAACEAPPVPNPNFNELEDDYYSLLEKGKVSSRRQRDMMRKGKIGNRRKGIDR